MGKQKDKFQVEYSKSKIGMPSSQTHVTFDEIGMFWCNFQQIDYLDVFPKYTFIISSSSGHGKNS